MKIITCTSWNTVKKSTSLSLLAYFLRQRLLAYWGKNLSDRLLLVLDVVPESTLQVV